MSEEQRLDKKRPMASTRDYLALMLNKLEDISTHLEDQNRILRVLATDQAKSLLLLKKSGERQQSGYFAEQTGDDYEEGEYDQQGYNEDGGEVEQDTQQSRPMPPEEHIRWMPPRWGFRKEEPKPEIPEVDGEVVAEEEETELVAPPAPPEEPPKPQTPRCPRCGMITQFYESENDHYCWMCEKYLSEM
jgi:hypothetical protein